MSAQVDGISAEDGTELTEAEIENAEEKIRDKYADQCAESYHDWEGYEN
jgi:hypothetical protein